jgi:hypothetical protein
MLQGDGWSCRHGLKEKKMGSARNHTTIGIKKATKEKLDRKRAPGQCYDGFLCQLIDLWDEVYEDPLKTLQDNKRSKEEVKL